MAVLSKLPQLLTLWPKICSYLLKVLVLFKVNACDDSGCTVLSSLLIPVHTSAHCFLASDTTILLTFLLLMVPKTS